MVYPPFSETMCDDQKWSIETLKLKRWATIFTIAKTAIDILIVCRHRTTLCLCYRPIYQTVFMLSIAINRAKHVCATVIIKHNYLLRCNNKIVINIMLCLLNSTGHI